MSNRRTPSRLQATHKRCRTGCVGVSLRAKTVLLKSGPRTRFYFQACVGSATGRKRFPIFRIDTLGRAEAFRRAVRARAEYEIAVQILRGERGGAR